MNQYFALGYKSCLVLLSIYCGGAPLSNLMAQAKMSSTEEVIQTLNSLQEKLPYKLAYSEEVVNKMVGAPITFDHNMEWRQFLKSFERQFKLKSRIVGENLILFPKQKYLLQGFIYDERTGESLPGAHLVIKGTQFGIVSNDAGHYQIWLSEGPTFFEVSYLGYEQKSYQLIVDKTTYLDINLTSSLDLPTVVVQEKDHQRNHAMLVEGQQIPTDELEDLPSIGASMDIARYVQFLPGVNTGGDGFGGVHVRGGNADQNLVLLEDMPIYNAFHLFGVSSIFNGDVIQKADLSKSYFRPQHMGRLSSVLDINVRDGHRNRTSFNASAGMLGSHGVLEKPILRKKGTLMIAGQRSHAGELIKAYSEKVRSEAENDGFIKPKYWDFYTKAMIDLGRSHKLVLNAYGGADSHIDINRYLYEDLPDTSFSDQYRDEYMWGNLAAGVKWIHSITGRAFMKINLYHTRYNYQSLNAYRENIILDQLSIDGISELTEFKSSVMETGMSGSLDFVLGYKHELSTGWSLVRHTYAPGVIAYGEDAGAAPIFSIDSPLPSLADSLFDALSFSSSQATIFLEDVWDLSHRWKVNAGFATTLFNSLEANFFSLQPRILVAYQGNKGSFRFAINKLFQPQHRISVSDSGLPNELWVPATDKIKPQEAWSTDFGWRYQLSDRTHFSSTLYYKKMTGLVRFRDDPSYLGFGPLDNIDASLWESDVVSGNGESFGIENSVGHTWDKISIKFNYTFARSSRFFAGTNLDQKVPYEFEVPHTANLVLKWKASAHWQFGMTWQIASGTRYNLIPGLYELYDRDSYFLEYLEVSQGALDLLVLPTYHRLDLVVGYEFGSQTIGHRLKLSLLNLYDRRNLVLPRLYRGEPTEIRFGEGLPFIPSFSYAISLN